MKIVAGTFGVKGSGFISRDEKLVIEGAKKSAYKQSQIDHIESHTEKDRKLGLLIFILVGVVLGILLGFLYGRGGVITAVILAAIISAFYSEEKNFVDINFTDGQSVSLDCTPRGVKKLIRFAASE